MTGAALRYDGDALRGFTRDVLAEVGMAQDPADVVARCLVDADLAGVDSHGIRQLPRYARALADGAIDASARPAVVARFGATARVDAAHGMGHPAAMLAAETAAELAREFGIGLVGVRNSNHFGAAFPYATRVAELGCIGFLTTNGPPVMVPTGGAAAAICNNPIAWAIPTRTPPAIVLDMACSAAARGRIRLAQHEGRTIPDGWATDATGRPTTDPTAALAGFLQPAGGPKGYGLAVVNEVLAGALTASPVLGGIPADVVSSDSFAASLDLGHVVIAIAPGVIGDAEAFEESVEGIRAELRATPAGEGVERVMLPGEIEHALRVERTRAGIPLAASTVASLASSVEDLGLRVPVPPPHGA